MRNVRLTVAYDGTDFHGFAMNGELRTVMGVLTAAVSRVVRRPVELTGRRADRCRSARVGTGRHRDDPGRHRPPPAAAKPQRAVPPDIAVRSIDWAEPGFSARFSATSRSYRYDIWNHPQPNPLIARTVVARAVRLDVDAMNERPAS